MENESKISWMTAIGMVSLSVFFDLVEFCFDFFVVGYAVNKIIDWLVAFPIFTFWFKVKGVKFFSGQKPARKIISLLSDLVIDWIPFVDSLGWTIDVVLVITAVWAEEKAATRQAAEAAASAVRYANQVSRLGQEGPQIIEQQTEEERILESRRNMRLPQPPEEVNDPSTFRKAA